MSKKSSPFFITGILGTYSTLRLAGSGEEGFARVQKKARIDFHISYFHVYIFLQEW